MVWDGYGVGWDGMGEPSPKDRRMIGRRVGRRDGERDRDVISVPLGWIDGLLIWFGLVWFALVGICALGALVSVRGGGTSRTA